NRAVVNVKFADRDRDARGEPKLRRPLGAQRAGRFGCIVSLFVKAVSKFGETQVEGPQEFLVRKAAPIVGIEGLVTGGADTSFDQSRVDDPSEYGGDPVGKFNPGESSAERLGSDIQTVPDLSPKPLRRVNPAAFRNVLGANLCAELGDFRRLAPTGVIFPQPALRVEVVLPFGARSQRLIFVVNRNRA